MTKAPRKDLWPDADIATLLRMWNAGKSAGEICKVMRRSRCSIIGKAARLRASGIDVRMGECTTSVREKREYLAPRKGGLPRPRVSFLDKTVRVIAIKARRTSEPTPPVKIKGVPLRYYRQLPEDERIEASLPGTGLGVLELKPRSCRRPTGGSAPQWLFCGATVDTGSYCNACRPFIYSTVSSSTISEAAE